MHLSLPTRLALEVWRNSGDRTVERLDALCEHYADVYGKTQELADIQQQARRQVDPQEVTKPLTSP